MISTLKQKIENYVDEITKLRLEMMDDAEVVIVSYGSVSRAALQSASIARNAGYKVGVIQLYTIWPFPDKELKEYCSNCRKVIVGELNMGQIVHEMERILPNDVEIHTVQRYDGEILTPRQFLEKLEEVL